MNPPAMDRSLALRALRLINDFAIRKKLGTVSALLILCFILLAVLAPLLAPYDPALPNYREFLQPPSAQHWIGTDAMGRDVLSRILHGMRISLITAFVPTFLSLALGALLGMTAALSGRKVDALIMRTADIVLAYPFMILAMAMIYNLGAGFVNLLLVLCLTGWAGTARIVRSETARLKTSGFVEAARTTGVGRIRIMARHILPNIRQTLLVLYTVNVPGAILSEAGLSFLGLGAQPPLTSLGLMVAQGREHLFNAPWISLGPAFCVLLLAMSFNFLGDGIREYLDPGTGGPVRR